MFNPAADKKAFIEAFRASKIVSEFQARNYDAFKAACDSLLPNHTDYSLLDIFTTPFAEGSHLTILFYILSIYGNKDCSHHHALQAYVLSCITEDNMSKLLNEHDPLYFAAQTHNVPLLQHLIPRYTAMSNKNLAYQRLVAARKACTEDDVDKVFADGDVSWYTTQQRTTWTTWQKPSERSAGKNLKTEEQEESPDPLHCRKDTCIGFAIGFAIVVVLIITAHSGTEHGDTIKDAWDRLATSLCHALFNTSQETSPAAIEKANAGMFALFSFAGIGACGGIAKLSRMWRG